MTKPPKPPDDLDRLNARRILAQMGENGKPPELGISHVNVGTESYLRVIDGAYVGDLITVVEGSSFKLVQGTYGSGKTHFLYCVRDLAWRRGLLAAFVTISPKECPFNRPLAIYKAIAQRIELARGPEGEATRGIDDVIRKALEDKVAHEGLEEAHAWLDKKLARAAITRHSFRDAAVGFARAVLDKDQATARRLAAWLRGEEITASEAKQAGVYELPSNENGFGMFRSLVQLVHQLGFEGTVVLLDEAERRLSIDSKPTKAMSETIDHLRELVDMCGRSELPRTLVLYAVTPAFTRDVLPMYPALQQRLGAPIQFLSAHNPKAPVIDLEALDFEPKKLLVELGKRLLRVAKRAYQWSPDDKLALANLDKLADTVAEEQLEVGHRRWFVKLWIRMLDQQRLGGERALAEEDIAALIRDEQALQVEELGPDDEIETFFGIPYRPNKKGKT